MLAQLWGASWGARFERHGLYGRTGNSTLTGSRGVVEVEAPDSFTISSGSADICSALFTPARSGRALLGNLTGSLEGLTQW
jgi:hypothetical protein